MFDGEDGEEGEERNMVCGVMEASENLLDKQRDFHEEDASSSDKDMDSGNGAEWSRPKAKELVD
jgi:hypothetical protein